MLLRPTDETTSGIGGDPAIAEHSRLIHNLITVGKISEVDYENLLVRVCTLLDEEGQSVLTTGWIPWTVSRAGGDVVWSAPAIGESVILVCPSGNLSNAFVMSSTYSNASPVAKADRRVNLHRTIYKDGAISEYDQSTGAALLDLSQVQGNTSIVIKGAKNVTIQATECITLNSQVVIKGNLYVEGATYAWGNGAFLPLILRGNPIELNPMVPWEIPRFSQ